MQQSVPCACFGRLGRTAAGGREIGRGIALVAGAAFLVVHRALDAGTGYGAGPVAAASVVVTGLRDRRGATHRREGAAGRRAASREPVAGDDRSPDRCGALTGYDNDLYTSGS